MEWLAEEAGGLREGVSEDMMLTVRSRRRLKRTEQSRQREVWAKPFYVEEVWKV